MDIFFCIHYSSRKLLILSLSFSWYHGKGALPLPFCLGQSLTFSLFTDVPVLFDKEVKVLCELTCEEIFSVALLLQVVQVFFISSTKSQGNIFLLFCTIKKRNTHIAKAVGKTSGSPTELAREGFKTRGDGSISKVFAEQA